MPPSAERTRDVIAKIEKIALETPGVKNVNSVAGNSFVLERLRLELRVDVHHSRRISTSAARRNCTADAIIGKLASAVRGRSARGAGQRVPAAGRVRAWGAPAASSSWSKTAATSG